MTDQEDDIILGKIVFDDNNQERKTWSCLGQTCSRSLIVFLSQLFVISLIIFGWNFVQCGKIHFTFSKIMNKLISSKNRVFVPGVQHSQPLYEFMQNEIESLEFVRGVNFELIDSLKNNGTKYLLISHDYCEEICNSKAFLDIATAGRHRE